MLTSSTWIVGASLFALIAFAGIASKKWLNRLYDFRFSSGRLLTLKESLALDPRRRLHIISYGEDELLLLTGGHQDLFLGWISRK